MMWPPQSVKIVSTPSFFRALATRWPPEMTSASRLLRLSVSSAVVVVLLSAGLGAVSSIKPPFLIPTSATAGSPSSQRRCPGTARRGDSGAHIVLYRRVGRPGEQGLSITAGHSALNQRP